MRLLVLVSAALLACSANPAAPSALGTWGGQEASLTLSVAGGALDYPCGSGHIAPGWTLDDTGGFSATGVHYFGGGPVPVPGPTPHPALYAGVVRGDRFDFTVTVVDLGQTLGPFHMVRGGPPVFLRCL